MHCIARVPALYDEASPAAVRIDNPETRSISRYLGRISTTIFTRNRVDLVLTEHINLLPVAITIAARHRASLGLVIHGFEAWNRPRFFLPGILRCVDQVVSVSAVTRDRFLSWSRLDPSRVKVIPNAVPENAGPPAPGPDRLIDHYGLRNCQVLLTVGRLDADERAKGFDETIRALATLKPVRPTLRYLIVGDGADRSRLERLASSLGVADEVIFAGQIADNDKTDHYRIADVYVMPSRLEGFGYVFLEAMACGVPVIGSTLDGSREPLLDGKLGQLVDPDSPEQLVSAIEHALTCPRQVPGQLSRFSLALFERRIQRFLLGPLLDVD